jgi:hypothetical protein
MRTKVMWLLVLFVFSPKPAVAQMLMPTFIFQPAPNSDFTLMGGVALPIIHVDRVSAGVGGHLGAVWDSSDPARFGETHAHPTWMVSVPVIFRIGESWGVMGGYGWGFVPKSAKTHLNNYHTWLAGLAFGL